MNLRKTRSRFIVFFLILFLSVATVYAGGKKENAEDTTATKKIGEQTEQSASEDGTASGARQGTPIMTNGDDVVATVNGKDISRSDFEQLIGYVQMQYQQQGMQVQGPQLEQLKMAVLESLIDDELLYQIALEAGYSPTEQEVKEKLDLTKQQVGNEESYTQLLSQQGLTEDDLKQEIRKGLVREKFEMDRFMSGIEVKDADVKSFYEENTGEFTQPFQFRTSHVLLQVEEDASEEDREAAQAKIESALQRIEDGEEFSEVAREVSDCPSSKNGGDLNYNGKGSFVPEFEEVALELEIGEISDVVETQFGYHIIKLTDLKEEQVVPLQQVRGQIEDYLLRVKAQEKRSAYLEEKKPSADIQRKPLDG
jgi:peptidyl-prolyl cis-trans isomerase C